MSEISRQQEISQIQMGRPHLVLLGAGASLAAFPTGDKYGRKLPVMANFVDTLSVDDIFERAGITYKGQNFEEMYSQLWNNHQLTDLRQELDDRIYDYFSELQLPDSPTLYDYLILSLRKKDVIATFNWDPFLILAARRNQIAKDNLPTLLFLHGNVLSGYCKSHRT